MRLGEAVRGTWWRAALAALLLLAAACAPPKNAISLQQSPTPSPSPTPTAPVAVSAGAAFHGGEVGIVYSPVALSATGGVAPYAWSISSGALPGGMTLGNDGTVSGTPNAAGSFTFTIQVADSGNSSATLLGTVSVAAALSASLTPACATYCSVELGCASVCGSFGQQSGGVGPYAYTLTQGPLPAGTSLSGLSLAGTFGGSSGWLQFTVQVSDTMGATATVAPRFWMYPHLAFGGGAIPVNPQFPCWWTGAGPNAPGCTARFPYSGGTPGSGTVVASASWASYSQTCTPPPNAAPAPCGPPPMPAVTVGGGVVTVAVPGAGGYWGNGYRGALSVTLTNQDTCSAGPTKCSVSATIMITQQGG